MCGHPSRSLQATRGWENVRGRRRPLPSCALFQEKLFAALQREGGEILTLTLLPPSLRPQSGIQKSSRSHFCALHTSQGGLDLGACMQLFAVVVCVYLTASFLPPLWHGLCFTGRPRCLSAAKFSSIARTGTFCGPAAMQFLWDVPHLPQRCAPNV